MLLDKLTEKEKKLIKSHKRINRLYIACFFVGILIFIMLILQYRNTGYVVSLVEEGLRININTAARKILIFTELISWIVLFVLGVAIGINSATYLANRRWLKIVNKLLSSPEKK